MCLAIPGRVISVSAEEAVIDYNGIQKAASLRFFPDISIDTYVLVHAGFIIQILIEDEALELEWLNSEVKNNVGRGIDTGL